MIELNHPTTDGPENLPLLPNDRLPVPEHLERGEPVVVLFDRSWMDGPQWVEGVITDTVPYDMPFILRLPRGVIFQNLVDQVMEESDEALDREELLTDPQAEPLRQFMLNSPKLRAKMPSLGFVNIETPKTEDNPGGRIKGVDINLRTLIPKAALHALKTDRRFFDAWLADGEPDGLTDQVMLEQATALGDQLAAVEEAHEYGSDDKYGHPHPSRARSHLITVPKPLDHKVVKIVPDPSLDNN